MRPDTPGNISDAVEGIMAHRTRKSVAFVVSIFALVTLAGIALAIKSHELPFSVNGNGVCTDSYSITAQMPYDDSTGSRCTSSASDSAILLSFGVGLAGLAYAVRRYTRDQKHP